MTQENNAEKRMAKQARELSAQEIDDILRRYREELAQLRGEMDEEDEGVILGASNQCEREQELEEIIDYWELVKAKR